VRRATVFPLALLLLVVAAGTAYAVFSAQKTVPSNAFTTAADWSPPTTSSSVIAKTVGYAAGYIKQGGTFYVYANVADVGNPPAGVSTVTANVSTITTGQTAVSLVAGSYSIGGVSYNYRTNSITANASLNANTYTYSITATDAGSRSATTNSWSVVVDNTAPSASDIQSANKTGGLAGRAEIGDTITFTFSEPIEPNSILAGWTGASTNAVVRMSNGFLLADDSFAVYNSSNTSQLPLGSVVLGRGDYVSSSITFGASGTASTMALSGSTITITLGTQSSAATTAGGNGTMAWSPSATATDRAGNACSTANRNETGGADKEF
jgi:hypothetical protein